MLKNRHFWDVFKKLANVIEIHHFLQISKKGCQKWPLVNKDESPNKKRVCNYNNRALFSSVWCSVKHYRTPKKTVFNTFSDWLLLLTLQSFTPWLSEVRVWEQFGVGGLCLPRIACFAGKQKLFFRLNYREFRGKALNDHQLEKHTNTATDKIFPYKSIVNTPSFSPSRCVQRTPPIRAATLSAILHYLGQFLLIAKKESPIFGPIFVPSCGKTFLNRIFNKNPESIPPPQRDSPPGFSARHQRNTSGGFGGG